MPLITDKFGRASIPTDVAIATTVKTTRVAGVLVLEAIDLSKYSVDTPVFVVTYKKTTDPVTGVVTISQLRSWKALVNVGANTLTNLTIQPGYADDIGNAVGDFIECIPTSAWENSLIDGIRTSLNDDGTLKTSAVQAALGISGGVLNGWNILGFTPSSIVDQGQRNYLVTISGTDKTDTLSPGTRLLATRTTAAPTYMGGAFNGTNHYFTKVTPTGLLSTVTDNWTLMGFIQPTIVPASSIIIAARADATGANSIYMKYEADGRISVGVTNGGAGNFRQLATTNPANVNKRTHVAATWAAGVVKVYIDGVDTPLISAATGGTAPTVAGTGGDFSIGRDGAANQWYWQGYISGIAMFNAVLSQATILQYRNQALTGAEANCIGAWSLNNTSVNQQAPGTNDLSAQNGVSYTNQSPYATNGFDVATGNLDYGIVMTSTFTGGNTVLNVHMAANCTLPTIGTLVSIQYSYVKSPIAFPGEKSRWTIGQDLYTANATSGTVNGTVYNPGTFRLVVPLGKWVIRGRLQAQVANTSQLNDAMIGASTNAGAVSNPRWVAREYVYQGAATFRIFPMFFTDTLEVLAQTPVYAIIRMGAAFSGADIRGDVASNGYGNSYIEVENAYL